MNSDFDLDTYRQGESPCQITRSKEVEFKNYSPDRRIHRQTHVGWWRGVVVSVVRRTNEVTLRRARLVLGWVTVFGRVYHHGI